MMIKNGASSFWKNPALVSCMLLLAASVCSLRATAQAPRPFAAHEVIEIGGGQKIEILRCRGEGPVEECDCIYYTDKRQNGKRMWQNADQIRSEQKAALLEVTAAKDQAKQEAATIAAAKAKEAAARKAAKESETTASTETNEVLKTIKEQDAEIKSKGSLKASDTKKTTAKTQTARPGTKAMTLQEIARERDSINRVKEQMLTEEKPATENEMVTAGSVETEKTPASAEAEKAIESATPVTPAAPKETVQPVAQQPAAVTKPAVTLSIPAQKIIMQKSDGDSTVDFATLRKMEEENGGVSYEPVKSATDVSKPVADTVKKAVEEVTSPTHADEQEPAPKPKMADSQISNENQKTLAEDTVQPMATPTIADTKASEEAEKKKEKKELKEKEKAEKKAKKKAEAEAVKAAEEAAKSAAEATTTKEAAENTPITTDAALPVATDTAATEANKPAESVDDLKATMKTEMTTTDSAETKTAEPAVEKAKKEKKVKKSKKKKEEEEKVAPAPADLPTPKSVELTPLQRAAQVADSVNRANEKKDSSADESYRKPYSTPDSTMPAPEKKDINQGSQPVENLQTNMTGSNNEILKNEEYPAFITRESNLELSTDTLRKNQGAN